MATIYDSWTNYVTSSSDMIERRTRLIAIRDQLEDTLLTAAEKGYVSQYEFNSGQSIVKTSYRNPTAILEAIHAIDIMIQRLENRISKTTVVRLLPAKGGYNGAF